MTASAVMIPGHVESAPVSNHVDDFDSTSYFDLLELRPAFGELQQVAVGLASEVNGTPKGVIASTFNVGVAPDPTMATFHSHHASATRSNVSDTDDHDLLVREAPDRRASDKAFTVFHQGPFNELVTFQQVS